MNKELWKKAIEYHGHECMGLALGFRMGEEAKKIFGNQEDICCIMPAKTCITDGITVTTGASMENGRIKLDPSMDYCLFYLPDEEEGWAFTRKEMNFPKSENAIQIIHTANRDFLFKVEPVDLD